MLDQPLCFFSTVRYVADPIRNEPKNIGIILVCPERNFGKAKFALSRSGIASDTYKSHMLQSLIQSYSIDLPGYYQQPLFGTVPSQWTNVDLERLYVECTNLIQFTKPASALGEPIRLLNDLYHERVQAQESWKKSKFTRGVAGRIFHRIFKSQGIADWVKENADVQVGNESFRFDLIIKNGKMHYAIETLSFQSSDLRRAEHDSGWYAHVWPHIADMTGAKGLLLVEPPKDDIVIQDRFHRVTNWMVEAGISVYEANKTEEVAKEILVNLL